MKINKEDDWNQIIDGIKKDNKIKTDEDWK